MRRSSRKWPSERELTLNSDRYLVTGGTGAVGPRIVQALRESGSYVRVLALEPPPPGSFPEGVEVLLGDITNRAIVESAIQGIDRVIHLAALLHIENPPPALREKYENVNVGGTAQVMEAARKAGVKRVVFFSTISVYGQVRDAVLTEDTSPRPRTYYAETKLAAEKVVSNARRSDGAPLGAVLRFGAVYGSKVKGNYQRLLFALARGRFLPIGDGLNRRTIIYDRDVARAALLAVNHPAAAGRVYNVSDGEFHQLRGIIGAICTALGRRPPRFSLPLGPVRLSVGIFEQGMAILGLKAPIRREMIDKYTEDIAVDSGRIQRELGFSPKYDLLTGWQETVQEMRQSGQLQ